MTRQVELPVAPAGAHELLPRLRDLGVVGLGPRVACYLWLDRYEPEPRPLLALGLLWGGFVATAVALVVQGLGGFVVGFTDEQSLAVVAPVTEEFSKGLFLAL